MIVIGLSGKARTGKSLLTRELYSAAESLGWIALVRPFAGPLKAEAAAQGFGKDQDPEKYREYCQRHGAEMREVNPDYWVNKWYDDIKDLKQKELDMKRPLMVLVDDVRYANEVDILRKHGGTVAYVKHGEREIDDPNGEWRQHESEVIANELETLDDRMIKDRGYHYVIHNDGNPDQLPRWAKNFINKVAIVEDCPCESCISSIENRVPDPSKVDNELRKLLDDLEDKLDDQQDD